MTVKRIELGIDATPKHFRVAGFVGFVEQVERLFVFTERSIHKCEVIWRDVTMLSKLVHPLERGLSLLDISGGCVRAGEPSESVRGLAHQIDTTLRRFNRLCMTAQTAEHETRSVKHHQVPWLVFERRTRKAICFIETARVIRTPDHTEARDDCQWIQIATGVRFAQRLTEATFHRQLQCVPNARRCVVGIELDCANQVMFGAGPRKIASKYRLPQSRVCFGEVRIQINGGGRSFIRRCRAFGERHHAENAEPVVIVCDARVSQRVFRIERDRLLITDDRPREALFGKRIPVKASAQVRFVRLRIVCAALRQSKSLVHSQVRHDRFGDVRRDHVFKIQNVSELLVKLSGPRRCLISDV